MNNETVSKRVGSEGAAEIYIAVGLALSWWESSEDVLMGAYRYLCAESEPASYESYISAPRAIRSKMFKAALNIYSTYYDADETKVILGALKKLDALAQTRNQIAHGHVTKHKRQEEGKTTMDGYFLVPSLNEHGLSIAREFRYALTAKDIDTWRDKVRDIRAAVMDAVSSAMDRKQKQQSSHSQTEQLVLSIAKEVAKGEVPPSRLITFLTNQLRD